MTNEDKLRQAKQYLGEKYLLHPSRRVQRLNQTQNERQARRAEPGESTVPV